MLFARLGALILLIGFGFAFAQLAQLMYVVAVEGYSSWIPVLILIVPLGVVAAASGYLILHRRALGWRLVWPLIILVAITAVITFLALPPAGQFLDDYEEARLARGVDVPAYREEQGWDARRYVEQQTADLRGQGMLGALAAVGFYALLVRFGRPKRTAPVPA